MDIIIAGAGEVGRHTAAVLAASNHQITLLDRQADKLETIAENLDARTLVGLATRADALVEAGADRADLFVAATDSDEINLLAASIAKGLGTKKTIARVHHSVYHERRGMDYARHLHIDRLICPEYLTSLVIAGVLRDPAMQAIEHFARGRIVMERIEISEQAEVVGKSLKELSLPAGIRIGTVSREGRSIVPTGDTVLGAGDQIAVVGETGVLDKLLPMFRKGTLSRKRIVIWGGSATSVWLTRLLDPRFFRVRLCVTDHVRAEELAEKLPHATVLEVNPTDPDIFAEENMAEADAFVGVTNDDEDNILGALQAKHLGVQRALVVVNRFAHHHLIEGVGIDHVFSPRTVAARAIEQLVHRKKVERVAVLDDHGTGIYEIDVGIQASVVGQPLMKLELPAGCVLVAIERGDDVHVPGPRDVLTAGDTVVAIAHEDLVRQMNSLFT